MNKMIPLTLLAMMASGCSTDSQRLDAQQLVNQTFILQSVDGVAVSDRQEKQPEIAFSHDMRVSGMMCNRFFGQGEVNQGVLKVKQLGATHMLCSDAQLNAWDKVIDETLMTGAAMKLEQGNLILSGAGHTLTYQAAK